MGCCVVAKNQSKISKDGSGGKKNMTTTKSSRVKTLPKGSNLTDRTAKIEKYYHDGVGPVNPYVL